MRSSLLLATLAAAIGWSCGSAPAPVAVAPTAAAIRSAEEVGAPADPQAALHLKLAREQYEEAQKAIEDGKRTRARSLLARAEADAELALALARESKARDQARAFDNQDPTVQPSPPAQQ